MVMYAGFQLRFGLDGWPGSLPTKLYTDGQGPRTSLQLKVLVDGKERDLLPGDPKTDGLRTWKDGPLTVRMDVKGAQELILAVEFADFGDVQGFVDWADARLIK